MKRIMLAVCLMFGGAAFVNAQEQQDKTSTQSQSETSMQEDKGQPISVSELPEEVTAKLESPDYSGWMVASASKKTDDSQNEIYVVEMRQGTETKTVKFDRDGNKIEGKDKHKKDNSNYRDNSSEQDATQEDATQEDATDQADNTETQPDQK